LTPAQGGEYEIGFFNGYAPTAKSGTNVTYAPANWSLSANLQAARANMFYIDYPLGLGGNGNSFATGMTWPNGLTYRTAWFNAALNPAF
jgi:hypothetical protein